MNDSRTRTGRIVQRLVVIWHDTRYASQRLTAINRQSKQAPINALRFACALRSSFCATSLRGPR